MTSSARPRCGGTPGKPGLVVHNYAFPAKAGTHFKATCPGCPDCAPSEANMPTALDATTVVPQPGEAVCVGESEKCICGKPMPCSHSMAEIKRMVAEKAAPPTLTDHADMERAVCIAHLRTGLTATTPIESKAIGEWAARMIEAGAAGANPAGVPHHPSLAAPGANPGPATPDTARLVELARRLIDTQHDGNEFYLRDCVLALVKLFEADGREGCDEHHFVDSEKYCLNCAYSREQANAYAACRDAMRRTG